MIWVGCVLIVLVVASSLVDDMKVVMMTMVRCKRMGQTNSIACSQTETHEVVDKLEQHGPFVAFRFSKCSDQASNSSP